MKTPKKLYTLKPSMIFDFTRRLYTMVEKLKRSIMTLKEEKQHPQAPLH
jgi:hypothetical protein